MNWLRSLLRRLFRRKVDWDQLDYGKPAKVEDEFSKLNGEC